MTFEEKYGLVYIKGRRYYKTDIESDNGFYENTVPYLFKYENIKVYTGSWSNMTLKVLNEIDNLNPKTEEELLELKYSWSKQNIFSREKRTNHMKFKNIYLNTNHTAQHAFMSLKALLIYYGVNLSKCELIISKHQVVEPDEVKEFVRNTNISKFRKSLIMNGFNTEMIEATLKNIEFINKLLRLL